MILIDLEYHALEKALLEVRMNNIVLLPETIAIVEGNAVDIISLAVTG